MCIRDREAADYLNAQIDRSSVSFGGSMTDVYKRQGLRFALLGGIVFLPTAMMYGLAQESRKMNRIWPGAVFSLVMWRCV